MHISCRCSQVAAQSRVRWTRSRVERLRWKSSSVMKRVARRAACAANNGRRSRIRDVQDRQQNGTLDLLDPLGKHRHNRRSALFLQHVGSRRVFDWRVLLAA